MSDPFKDALRQKLNCCCDTGLSCPTHGERLRVLAKHQPCGCVICTCEDPDHCHGCGAKSCRAHPIGAIPNPVYEDTPHSDTPETDEIIAEFRETSDLSNLAKTVAELERQRNESIEALKQARHVLEDWQILWKEIAGQQSSRAMGDGNAIKEATDAALAKLNQQTNTMTPKHSLRKEQE